MLRASLEYVKDPFERDDISTDLRLAEIALAVLTTEPVGEVVLGEYDDCGCHPDARVACIAADGQADWENFKDGTRLYTAPPAPVSVPDALADDIDSDDHPLLWSYNNGWNACRAAMLQGAEPVTTANKLREGVAAIRNSGIAIDAENIQAERDALNSPSITDGWVACSERMPETEGHYLVWVVASKLDGYCDHQAMACYQGGEWSNEFNWLVTHWMPLPAAPQQEA
ncbi:DUF551 domain-containing protein [Enterobacter hormaechei]|nr:DUF551 domain-containing protein [Enterobacter hormaechei]MCM7949184.1 DUF551 domain-containing protein [Enterobacter hormaechei]